MFKRHLSNILTYTQHRLTNAVAEGFNNKIQFPWRDILLRGQVWAGPMRSGGPRRSSDEGKGIGPRADSGTTLLELLVAAALAGMASSAASR